jgi:hypothetical protein
MYPCAERCIMRSHVHLHDVSTLFLHCRSYASTVPAFSSRQSYVPLLGKTIVTTGPGSCVRYHELLQIARHARPDTLGLAPQCLILVSYVLSILAVGQKWDDAEETCVGGSMTTTSSTHGNCGMLLLFLTITFAHFDAC